MTIGMSVVNLSWTELLLARHVFCKVDWYYFDDDPVLLLTILWRRKQKA
jgi:hypothetical protein